MPVSSFSNRSFAYRRGDKQGRIVSRVGPYPVNKPSTTTSNGVEYSQGISGMYAFGHTPGAPNYGNLDGGVNGTYNHGWWNGITGDVQRSARFLEHFYHMTSDTIYHNDGLRGFRTVSFHGPNNKLYGWIDHGQRWYNDPGDAQTAVGGGTSPFITVQVNGPGSGEAYTYYFDSNEITGNTNSPSMANITDLRFWSGTYPTGETNNFQEGVNGLLYIGYIQRSPGFSSITDWRDKDSDDAPSLGFGAQLYFSNTTDATIFRDLLAGIVQLPTTSGAYSQYNGHKPIRFHFKDGTVEDFGPDDGSTTQRVWSTGGSSTNVQVYTTAADNSSRTMSLSGGSMTTVTGGSYNFASTASRLSASNSQLQMSSSDFTIDLWVKINTHTNARQYLFTLGSDKIYASVESNGSGFYYWFDGYTMSHNQSLTLGRWYHLRFVRSGSKHYMFVDGDHRADITINRSISGQTINLNSDGYGNASGMTDGNISDFRIIKGVALNTTTTSFTPPGALTAVSGTVILTAQNSSGSFVDNGPNSITISSTGTVTPQTGAVAPVDFTQKEIIGISYATISGHGGHDDPYLIGQNVASHLFHNNVNGQTQIFGQYTDP